MKNFDPNDIGIRNGNIFGFPISEDEADIVIVPVPWDVTASFGKGTAEAPAKILEASLQLDFHHPNYELAHSIKVNMTPISSDMLDINSEFRSSSEDYLEYLEQGREVERDSKHALFLQAANEAHENIRNAVFHKSNEILQNRKIPAVVGGEHSAPLGLIESLGQHYKSFGIIQIDAHADLRKSYEGFEQSHASIFYNVLKRVPQVEQIIQVGVRDLSESENDRINTDDRLMTFFDWQLKDEKFNGRNWHDQVVEIVAELPEYVYVSFDIDGLQPSLCPKSGTPVPGGLGFEEARYLLQYIANAGKKIIGFDLCEVGNAEWDANVGARILWELVVATQISMELK